MSYAGAETRTKMSVEELTSIRENWERGKCINMKEIDITQQFIKIIQEELKKTSELDSVFEGSTS